MKGLRPRLLAFLRGHQVLTLAVAGNAAAPHAAALFYAVDDKLRFYVVTDPGTLHGEAMAGGCPVAGTVQRDQQSWHQLQGIQFHAPRAEQLLDDRSRRQGWGIYTTRFPFLPGNDVLTAALAKTALWRIEPDWIRLVDNRLGFGHKEEWHRHRRRAADATGPIS
jgi:uncharacterized protein YhbP (UPF0306 family)